MNQGLCSSELISLIGWLVSSVGMLVSWLRFVFNLRFLYSFKYALIYRVITNVVSDYINLLLRIARIICNDPILL
jgi:hypothetical protein